LGDERRAEAVDRQVGEREEMVEHDAEMLAELALVIRPRAFSCGGGRKGPSGL
jgi:hypothetical protein